MRLLVDALKARFVRAEHCEGDPGGYRWGIERKRALLEREAKIDPLVGVLQPEG
jgi:hypothetical protein